MDLCTTLSSKKDLLSIIRSTGSQKKTKVNTDSSVEDLHAVAKLSGSSDKNQENFTKKFLSVLPRDSVPPTQLVQQSTGPLTSSSTTVESPDDWHRTGSIPVKSTVHSSNEELEPDTDYCVLDKTSAARANTSNDESDFENFLIKHREHPVLESSSLSSISLSDNSDDTASCDNLLFYYRINNAHDRRAEFNWSESSSSSFEERTGSTLNFDSHRVFKKSGITKVLVENGYDSSVSFANSAPSTKQLNKPMCTTKPKAQNTEKCETNNRSYDDFLYSLSPLESNTLNSQCTRRRDPSAERFVKQFKSTKGELVTRLFLIFNRILFGNALPEDLQITWNSRLLKTAGQCKYLIRKTITAGGDQSTTRIAEIELAPKVCTSAVRVRDTLLHEICHAAVWILEGINDGHGPRWRHWSQKAQRTWPGLPVVSVCHAYSIETRYTYRCTNCGACVHRHSKSIDVMKQVCGLCHSHFELLLNNKRGQTIQLSDVGAQTNVLSLPYNKVQTTQDHARHSGKPSRRPVFADFVQKHYRSFRQKPDVRTHADAMTQLGTLFRSIKVSETDFER